jgi:hypothetical protein
VRISEPAFNKNGHVKQGAYLDELSPSSTTTSSVPSPIGCRQSCWAWAASKPQAASAGRSAPKGVTSGSKPSGVESGRLTGTAYRRAARQIQVRLRHGRAGGCPLWPDRALLGDAGSGRSVRRGYTASPWLVDLLLELRGVLLEVKPELTASEVQRGVGQLFLYRSMLIAISKTEDLPFDPHPFDWRWRSRRSPRKISWRTSRRMDVSCAWQHGGYWVDNADGTVTGRPA